ncbi:uncharacterized protein BDZ99DRAFT_527510 [Mytilinidion resinicola]|uniref:OPT superfamily oligopeptide transporter n=1 Tax=Mytilinidion resinicola TaxID=574789 RepID=A0A6A6Y391_9PEZI|nr:uncharacterized protein BDZ99DRAFT_527510 [Mytilinidion resinicola]KAF2802484.1 hypothetical protein BDZ99DRAFT_527510 [Mytilinidion resinicola]
MPDAENEAGLTPSERSCEENGTHSPPTQPTAERHNEQTFSLRGILAGLFIGTLICFASLYYGLQAGQTNSMPLPSVLLAHAVFKPFARYLHRPFNPSENVLVMMIAASMGVAAVIGVLHTRPSITENISKQHSSHHGSIRTEDADSRSLPPFLPESSNGVNVDSGDSVLHSGNTRSEESENSNIDNRSNPRMYSGLVSFIISGLTALLTYFVPDLQTLPIFGTKIARMWAWSVDISPAYLGFGMIMHPLTTAHMLLGAVIGWAFLSPLAKSKGWASGRVEDWDDGSQGWNIWVALGVILGDTLIGIVWVIFGLLRDGDYGGGLFEQLRSRFTQAHSKAKAASFSLFGARNRHSTPDERTLLLPPDLDSLHKLHANDRNSSADDALSNISAVLWLVGVTVLCVLIAWYLFGDLLPIWEISLSIILIFPLGIASIRSMGETDNALASILGKIPQFLFAVFIPKSNPNATIISLLVGGIAEAGPYQSSDVMEHLKTGHLVGASPKSLFYG